jgi:hypothetical protein
VRKLKAKGKEDPVNKDKHKEKEKEKDKLQKGGAPVEGSATGSDLDSDLVGSEVDEETGAGEKKEGETENEGSGHFSRRKVASNAWRYEEEEPEFPLGALTLYNPSSYPLSLALIFFICRYLRTTRSTRGRLCCPHAVADRRAAKIRRRRQGPRRHDRRSVSERELGTKTKEQTKDFKGG